MAVQGIRDAQVLNDPWFDKAETLASEKEHRRWMLNESQNVSGPERRAEKIRSRDHYTCKMCRRKWIKGQEKFHVHHIDKSLKKTDFEAYKNVPDDELITLCRQCHSSFHKIG